MAIGLKLQYLYSRCSWWLFRMKNSSMNEHPLIERKWIFRKSDSITAAASVQVVRGCNNMLPHHAEFIKHIVICIMRYDVAWKDIYDDMIRYIVQCLVYWTYRKMYNEICYDMVCDDMTQYIVIRHTTIWYCIWYIACYCQYKYDTTYCYLILSVLHTYFIYDIFKCIFLNENLLVSLKFSLKFGSKDSN